MDISSERLKYLQLMAEKYPTIQDVATEIINLQAIMNLPKGTEHFMSDLHGESEAFIHILNNCSGVVREKIDIIYGHTIPVKDRAELATLIYYPAQKLELVKRETPEGELDDWYRITLQRLIEVARFVATKYSRSRVRKRLPHGFSYIIDELLNTNYDERNKELYYEKIISTIIDIDRGDAFICALAKLIKTLAVDTLHIIGDIFDRGPRPDIIMELLMKHHSVDIQWGNHDVLWMGAAAGSEACIAYVLNNSMAYNNLDLLEDVYGINLRQLAVFAGDTYAPSKVFEPKDYGDVKVSNKDILLISQMRKAIAIILFKLEGQVIMRHPEYDMEDRLLLNMIDYEKGTILLDGKEYPLLDHDFPTIDPADPYRLTDEEQDVIENLRRSFTRCEKLQSHIRFLYAKGGLYRCHNSNLLFHGCIPLNADGSFTEVDIDGHRLKGKAYIDYAEILVRRGYFASKHSEERRKGEDFIWYLWCGKNSPVFGRNRMTTFERLLIADESTWDERKNPYYQYSSDEAVCIKILREFGLSEEHSHIMNGHVPVRTKDGESPIKANGRLVLIDGGFCKAYHPRTGIAGYTLIYNSQGMRIVAHEPFDSVEKAIKENKDIHSTSTVFESLHTRIKIADTDTGRGIKQRIAELSALLEAYRAGIVKETNHQLMGEQE